ncbi:MAG: tRNA pseudouridine(38-40) synthase TruA [Dehalococcoidales bacterium]|nr:tRNA pseudouridine(38-40) synthase TruA [Dehalococcoidales bacterium]
MALSAMTAPEIGHSRKLTTRMALVVEYDGTNYCGSQWQDNAPTVQGELEKALGKLTGEDIRIVAASRTDAGVHARGQVISFQTSSSLPVEAFIHGPNYHLPEDIAVKSAHRVNDSFLVRSMSISREYSYCILNSQTRSPLRTRFAHRVAVELDTEAMNRVCQTLAGIHDFASFASDISDIKEKSTVRQVYQAKVTRDGDIIVFNIVANAFIRHQIRSTAGALVQVGLHKMSDTEFASILEARKPGLAGPTLPACGLCLMRVNYTCSFEEMK